MWRSTDEMSDHPCYGRSWELDDDECNECDHEVSCRKLTLGRRKSKPARKIVPRSVDDEAMEEASVADEIMDRMPRDGEHWGERIGKNVASGMLSAMGREIMLFFKKWRW